MIKITLFIVDELRSGPVHTLDLPSVTDTCSGRAAHAWCRKMRFILHAKVVRIPFLQMEKLKRPIVKGDLQGLHTMVA